MIVPVVPEEDRQTVKIAAFVRVAEKGKILTIFNNLSKFNF